MKAGNALDTSDPNNIETMRQPYADPFQIGPVTWAAQRPNWGLPFLWPMIAGTQPGWPLVAQVHPQVLRSDDV